MSDIRLRVLLRDYIETRCDGNQFTDEDDFRDDLMAYMIMNNVPVMKEVQMASSPECGKDYWFIDLMIECATKRIPIELKYNEESEDEVWEDLDKIDYCINNNSDMEEGYVLLLTNAVDSNFEDVLEDTAFTPFRYAVWHRE